MRSNLKSEMIQVSDSSNILQEIDNWLSNNLDEKILCGIPQIIPFNDVNKKDGYLIIFFYNF